MERTSTDPKASGLPMSMPRNSGWQGFFPQHPFSSACWINFSHLTKAFSNMLFSCDVGGLVVNSRFVECCGDVYLRLVENFPIPGVCGYISSLFLLFLCSSHPLRMQLTQPFVVYIQNYLFSVVCASSFQLLQFLSHAETSSVPQQGKLVRFAEVCVDTDTILNPHHFGKRAALKICLSIPVVDIFFFFHQDLLKEKSNPRLKGNRKGIIIKGKEFYIPILKTFPTR